MNAVWLWFFLTFVDPLFVSEAFSYRVGKIPAIPENTMLEFGDAAGHGGSMTWIRFQPTKDGAEVLLIDFGDGWKPYDTKLPPDEVPISIKLAKISKDEHKRMLQSVAILSVMHIRPYSDIRGLSSLNFWLSMHAISTGKVRVHWDWAGYLGHESRTKYIHVQLAVQTARDLIPASEFHKHELTAEERKWASEKFTRDWEWLNDKKDHGFVRDAYLQMIGVVGDDSAVPTLKKVLAGDPKGHQVYHAINATTRLTKTDVRPKPVTSMDVNATREKLLEALGTKK